MSTSNYAAQFHVDKPQTQSLWIIMRNSEEHGQGKHSNDCVHTLSSNVQYVTQTVAETAVGHVTKVA